MAIKCGKCMGTHASVNDVRACYNKESSVATIERNAGRPATATERQVEFVQPGKYALPNDDDGWDFLEVTHGSGRWDGWTFVSVITGGPGDWTRYPLKNKAQRETLLGRIAEDPLAASVAFGKHTTTCGVCGSPLTKEESVEAGIGPICRAKTGW